MLEANEHEMAWRDHLDSRNRQRRLRICNWYKTRLRNAPPTASGMKPLLDLLDDVKAQHCGVKTFSENDFWRRLIRSIREGAFDGERELFCITDRKMRLTSKALRETFRWDENDDTDRFLFHAIGRNCWAAIATLSQWAKHQRYEIPVAWQAALNRAPPPQATDDQPAPLPAIIGKAELTRQAVLDCMSKNPQEENEQKKVYIARISKTLKGRGIKAGDSTIKNAGRFR